MSRIFIGIVFLAALVLVGKFWVNKSERIEEQFIEEEAAERE
jgi:hypothetical protein